MANIALMGHGVVGSGVAEVLLKNKEAFEGKLGEEVNLKYILDLRDFDVPYKNLFTKDFQTIVQDKSVSVVVEVMGGLKPAYDFVKTCLENGKSVVTSNKELVAAKGAELLRLAREHNVNFLFEASVGGGIPIIRPMHQCLAANEIREVAGILNGTTNFILTKMIREQMAFDEALKLAQSLGYAEKDPTADIEGGDACRKICILASLAYGKHVYPEQVKTEGITKLTSEDVAYAESWGGVIKLIGRAKKLENGKLHIMVSPAFISRESQLAGVDDVFNGILVRGDATGDVVFYGKGAGKLPTASAVVADIIDEIKHKDTIKTLYWEDGSKDYVEQYENYSTPMYIRCSAQNTKTALAQANELFGTVNMLARKNQPENEVAFVTPVLTEKAIAEGIKKLELSGVSVLAQIRILDY
ncbi:homoserine dehydrogenase [Acetanaerobacterium elongatum]|uniref:Homoserine dehydrogenase n=1 Tax=Acetanaerobacterium elongatum TaxID=258515 RepID=A0A1H0G6H6_9FIRM|nr:homoserine dehydrogenase [Acetanaerobacterium elongatum]SDO02456.1 homoserine dehydrogenase [Acetanaerobacterium elongatum]